jgi:hypothetical protein
MATNEEANRKHPGPAGHSRSPLVLVLLVLMLINVGATGWMLYSRRTGTTHQEATAASVEPRLRRSLPLPLNNPCLLFSIPFS